MFKLIVIGKNGREESDFATQAEAQAHFEAVRLTGHWGAEYRTIEHEEIPAVTVEHQEVPEIIGQDEVLNEMGEVIQPRIEARAAIPAWTEVISEAVPAWIEHIPAEYTYEIVSVSPRLEDISPRQIALALLSMGITESQVIAAINQLPSPQKEQGIIAWNRSNYFVRTEPAVAMIGALLSLNSTQLDDIWKIGITL